MIHKYRSLEEVPEHLRKMAERFGLTTHHWCGILFFDCSYPHCATQNEDIHFMIRHAQEHGIFPAEDAAPQTSQRAEPAEVPLSQQPQSPSIRDDQQPKTFSVDGTHYIDIEEQYKKGNS